MRQDTQRRARPRPISFALLVATICLLAITAPAFASSSADVVSPAPAGAASPAVASSPVPSTLTCLLSKAAVVFGDAVTVSGRLDPVAGGQEVTVKLGDAVVGTATTDAAGAYSLTFTPQSSGDVVAQLSADPAVVTAPQALSVKPGLNVSHGALVPFLASRFVVKVTPSAYDGVVAVKLVHRGADVGSYRARVKDGRAVLLIPLRGVDAFTLDVTAPAASGLDARSVQTKVAVKAKTLSAGSSGPYVKGMLTGLQRLAFRTPGAGSTFTSSVKDSVMAFQKAYRLSRTYVFSTACWRKLDGAKLLKPKFSSPSTHIEVDKTRQILMVVKGGQADRHHLRLDRRDRQHPRGAVPHPAEAPVHRLGVRRRPGAHDGFRRQLRHPRLRAGAAVSGEPRMHPRADLGLLLGLRQLVGGRGAVRLPLTVHRSRGQRAA